MVCIPLPYAVASIWPLPFGLLLQKSIDGNRPISSSSSLMNARDLSRPCKEYGLSHHSTRQVHSFEPVIKESGAMLSSHLVLKHPMEELQVCMTLGARVYLQAFSLCNQIFISYKLFTIYTFHDVPLLLVFIICLFSPLSLVSV